MNIYAKLITILFIGTITSTVTYAGGWIDDWVDQATHTGPQYFEGQKRGYFNAGSFSMRYRNTNENLFSVSKPRLRAGCGGIDLFMGSFSFMNPEYLMEKLQRSLQAAPAVAFDLALKEMCPECSATIKELESIINNLNQMQMSECGTAQMIATESGLTDTFSDAFGRIAGVSDSRLSAANSSSDSYYQTTQQQSSNDGRPTQDQQQSIDGCSADFKNIFAKPGSLLENIARSKGLEQYANYMRAYLGDVVISKTDNQFGKQLIDVCPDMDVTKVEDIVTGDATIRELTGNCTQASDQDLVSVVDTKLRSIANKINNKKVLTTDEIRFLNAIPFDVFAAINYASKNNSLDIFFSNMNYIIAKVMAYSMVDDLVNKINELTRIMQSRVNQGDDGVSSQTCDVTVLAPIITQVTILHERAKDLQAAIRLAKKNLADEVNANASFNKNITNVK